MAVEAVPVIVVDTREQLPLPIEGYDVERCILSIGDYGVKGFSDWANPAFIIERKSLSDLVHSLGKDRDRFEREVLKMKQFGFRALLIEALESEVQQGRYSSLMTVAAVLQSLAMLQVRHNVHVVWAGDRVNAARWLERAVRQFARGQVKYLGSLQLRPVSLAKKEATT